jgi:hypothetical protein
MIAQGVLLDSPPLDVFGQMALDEALAQSKPAEFCLRFFRWRGVGATFGYAQRIAEVRAGAAPAELGARARGGRRRGAWCRRGGSDFLLRFSGGGELRRRKSTGGCTVRFGGAARGRGGARVGGIGGRGRAARAGRRVAMFRGTRALDILAADRKILGGDPALWRHVLYLGSLQLPGRADGRAERLIAAALAAAWETALEAPGSAGGSARRRRGMETKHRSAEWIRGARSERISRRFFCGGACGAGGARSVMSRTMVRTVSGCRGRCGLEPARCGHPIGVLGTFCSVRESRVARMAQGSGREVRRQHFVDFRCRTVSGGGREQGRIGSMDGKIFAVAGVEEYTVGMARMKARLRASLSRGGAFALLAGIFRFRAVRSANDRCACA